MTKEELIVNQQLEIENYKENISHNKEIVKQLQGKLYSIGAPLNDNILNFNHKQLVWLASVSELIEEIIV
jgi:hypothetical protein